LAVTSANIPQSQVLLGIELGERIGVLNLKAVALPSTPVRRAIRVAVRRPKTHESQKHVIHRHSRWVADAVASQFIQIRCNE
jgi:hypothetical protein